MNILCCPRCRTNTEITVYKRPRAFFRWKAQCMKCNPTGDNWYYAVGVTKKDALNSWNFFAMEV